MYYSLTKNRETYIILFNLLENCGQNTLGSCNFDFGIRQAVSVCPCIVNILLYKFIKHTVALLCSVDNDYFYFLCVLTIS